VLLLLLVPITWPIVSGQVVTTPPWICAVYSAAPPKPLTLRLPPHRLVNSGDDTPQNAVGRRPNCGTPGPGRGSPELASRSHSSARASFERPCDLSDRLRVSPRVESLIDQRKRGTPRSGRSTLDYSRPGALPTSPRVIPVPANYRMPGSATTAIRGCRTGDRCGSVRA